MYQHRVKLGVRNSRDQPHVLWIEPWGEDFTLKPGEELELFAYSDSHLPWFELVESDGASAIYCEKTSEFEVFQNGVRLECGHNRQF